MFPKIFNGRIVCQDKKKKMEILVLGQYHPKFCLENKTWVVSNINSLNAKVAIIYDGNYGV